jgi:hypothetical protein
MDILLDWLNKTVQLSEKVTDIDAQFANGFLLCELLFSYNQILKFTNNERNDSTKTAVIKNYAMVFPIINGLKVHFDSNVALAMIDASPGVAVGVIRSLKNSLEKTKGTVDFQILKRTGQKNIVFPLKQFEPPKQKFEQVQLKLFVDRLNTLLPAQKATDLNSKLRKFDDTQKMSENKMQQTAFWESLKEEKRKTQQRKMLRDEMKMASTFKENLELKSNQNWLTNMQIFENRRLREERFRSKLKERENQLKEKQKVAHSHKVYDDIAKFETTFKKEIPPTQSGDNASDSETIDDLRQQKKVVAKEILEKLEVAKIREQVKLREKDLQSEYNKKERDRRLRKLIVDLKKWQTVKELCFLKEKAMGHILKESKEEEEVRYEFHKAKTFQRILEKNSELYQNTLREKDEEMTGQRQKTSVHQFNQLLHQLDYNMKFYQGEEMRLQDELNEKDMQEKYNECKKVLELFINSSISFYEAKNRATQPQDLDEAVRDLHKNLANLNETFRNPKSIAEIQSPDFELEKYQWYLQSEYEDYVSNKANWELNEEVLQAIATVLKELGLNSLAESPKGFAAEILVFLMNNLHSENTPLRDTDDLYDYPGEEKEFEEELKETRERELREKKEQEEREARERELAEQAAQNPVEPLKSADNLPQEKLGSVQKGLEKQASGQLASSKSLRRESIMQGSKLFNQDNNPNNSKGEVNQRLDKARSSKRLSNISLHNLKRKSTVVISNKVQESSNQIDDLLDDSIIEIKKPHNPFHSYDGTQTLAFQNEHIESTIQLITNDYPRHLPLKLAIIGPAFSQTRYVANFLGQKFNLQVISIDQIIKEMINWNTENLINDIQAKVILDKIFEGQNLDEIDQIYILQKVLNYHFEVLDKDEDYLPFLLRQRAIKDRKFKRELDRLAAEKQKRRTQYWKTKTATDQEIHLQPDPMFVDGRGFILCDFPSSLSAAQLLEKSFGYRNKAEDEKRESIEKIKGALKSLYPTLIGDSIELFQSKKESQAQLKVDFDALLDPTSEPSSIFDAVIMLDCESEEIYCRAFESFLDGNNQTVRLRNLNPEIAANTDFDQYKFCNLQETSPFTSYQDKLRFECEKPALVNFYRRFKVKYGSGNILIELPDDSEMKVIESMAALNNLLGEIMAFKNDKYLTILDKHQATDSLKAQNQIVKKDNVIEKRGPARISAESIKEKVKTAIANFNKSNLNNQTLLPNYLAMSFWTEFSAHYTSTVKDMLLRLHKQSITMKMINSSVIEKTVTLLNKPDAYNLHLRNFVDDYNEFYLTFPDILFQDEVKSEFHWRLNN